MAEVGCLKDGAFQNMEVSGTSNISTLNVSNVTVVPDLTVNTMDSEADATTDLVLVKNTFNIVTNSRTTGSANTYTLPTLAASGSGAIVEIYCAVPAGDADGTVIIAAEGAKIYGSVVMAQFQAATVATADTTGLITAQTSIADIASGAVHATVHTGPATNITLQGIGANKPGGAGTRLRFTNRNGQFWWLEGVATIASAVNTFATAGGNIAS